MEGQNIKVISLCATFMNFEWLHTILNRRGITKSNGLALILSQNYVCKMKIIDVQKGSFTDLLPTKKYLTSERMNIGLNKEPSSP